ncbi:hypothetical protein Tco_1113448 [Tanacetum coccineum]|uniref:Uncharacterized protein n=1 Tax=Tanacetum coccineum TaxID=301880 RepID=A0ABQ5ITR8_9ASTR
MRPLAVYVPEPGRGSSILIDLFTAFALTAQKFRISEAEGLHKGYDRMQKILSQLNQLKANPEDEDINLKFLRALPLLWSQVALHWKNKVKPLRTFVVPPVSANDSMLGRVWSYSPTSVVMIAGCDTEDAIGEGAANIYNLITGADTKKANTAGDAENSFHGVTSEWGNSSKNLSVILIVHVLLDKKWVWNFSNFISKDELGWDDSAFSVFTTNSEEVEGRPHFSRGEMGHTAVKLSRFSWKTLEKVLYWENSYTDAEDEGIFNSGCSRSMTDTDCLVLSKDFMLPDESMFLLLCRNDGSWHAINALAICDAGMVVVGVVRGWVGGFVVGGCGVGGGVAGGGVW